MCPTTRRAMSARFLDHWRPSLALFIESDLWPNLILSSAARRLPMVLINGRMSPRSFPRWRRVSGTISALLGRFEVCLAQSETDADRFSALGSPNVVTTGNLKLDVPAPPADPGQAGTADGDDARPPGRDRRLHPSRRGRDAGGGAQDARRILSGPADRDRAAASRSRRGDRAHGRGVRPARVVAFARGIACRCDRHLCRRHHGRTRPVLPVVADRVHGRIAGRAWRAKSDRGDQARRLDRARPARVQFQRRL